jgi:hypothetical protein
MNPIMNAEKPGRRRNPLLPWWIGLAIILVVDIFIGYRFTCVDCGPIEAFLAFGVLIIIPAVYLTLMYITFKSQAESETE